VLKAREDELENLSRKLEMLQETSEASPVSAPVSRKRESQARKLDPKRVLLVDQAEVNRVLLSHYFKGMPVKLDFARNVDQALESCGECQYDLLIVDIGLETNSDSSLAERLKSKAGNAGLFALSANAFSEQEESRVLGSGFHAYLAKSLSKEAVIERLSSRLWNQ
jgi:CheY-like chemotaxis protein